ncbi:hypothetical protein ACQ4M4_12200 [Leptolyngbya sp. AN02str]|uniref:hypothetical protein n=1 Tax=Leptolyngbya sp. AN02str TaxID=3423363 RepID=UPI003D31D282
MADFECNVPVPTSSQELDQAIREYRSSELNGQELFCQWQAIRDASIQQPQRQEGDRVPGDESY